MLDILTEYLKSNSSKITKYLAVFSATIVVASLFFENYLEEPKLTSLNTFLVPFVIVIFLFVSCCHFLYFYYHNCPNKDSRVTKVVLAVVPLALMVAVYGVSIQKGEALTDKATTLLSIGFSVLLAICWWIIRSDQAKLATKKNHTLNILLQSRLSSSYQEKLSEAGTLYTSDNNFPDLDHMSPDEKKKYERIVQYYGMMMTPGTIILPGGEIFEVDDSVVKVAVSVKGLIYLINYFEFLAVGIEKDDIYEPLIEECLKGIALSLKSRSIHLIKHFQEKDAETWEYFLLMCSRWESSQI